MNRMNHNQQLSVDLCVHAEKRCGIKKRQRTIKGKTMTPSKQANEQIYFQKKIIIIIGTCEKLNYKPDGLLDPLKY